MSHPSLLRPLRLIVLFLALAATSNLKSQVLNKRYDTPISSHIGGFYEYLPQGYGSGKKFPLLILLHGIGELGDGSQWQVQQVLANGAANQIGNGTFPASFTVNGQTFSFIVLMPQFKYWPGGDDVNDVIEYAKKNYDVDVKRIYLSGLSMGGGTAWDFASGNDDYPKKIAALVPVCGASGPNLTKAKTMAKANLPVWAFHNDGDPTVPSSYTIDYINLMNSAPAPIPSPLAKKTIFNNNSHNAWYRAYDPTYRENGMNMYEWMLQFTTDRGNNGNGNGNNGNGNGNNGNGNGNNGNGNGNNGNGNGNQASQAPVVNAGGAQTITQPATTATLTGSATAQTGGISSYAWTFVSGPNSYNIGTPWLAQTNLSLLIPGTYVFRLTAKDYAGNAGSADVTVTVNASKPITTPVSNPTPTPTPATNTASYTTIPARIKATKWSNVNNAETEPTSDNDGGSDVDYIYPGSWMDYNINVPVAGNYNVNLRVATPGSQAQLQIKSGNNVLSSVNLPNTGGFQQWQTVSTNVTLAQGQQTIRIYSSAPTWNNWNLNWLEFANGTQTPTPTPSTGSSIHIEAENYSDMFAVQTENTTDAGGGKDVDNINAGSWMNYSVNIATAGTYAIRFRVATPNSNAQLQVKLGYNGLTLVNLPNTGGYQSWQTVSSTITLAQGQQTLTLVSTGGAQWNINWLEIGATGVSITPAPVPVTATTIHVEAEDYANIFYAQTENTSDAGGGKDVDNNYAGSWMSYNLNIPAAATYKVNFRVASSYVGQFQLKNASGTTLALVNIPNTGGGQSWQTISTYVNLPQGQQTLLLVSTNSQPWITWNINWMDFISQGSLSGISANTSLMSLGTNTPSFDIYPNPVQDRFSLQVNNNYSGTMNVLVIDMTGAIKKKFTLTKSNAGATQAYLSIGDLPAGNYVVAVQMDQYNDTKKIVKQ